MEFIDYVGILDDSAITNAEREILKNTSDRIKEMIDNGPHMHIMVVDSAKLKQTGKYYWKCSCGLEILHEE